MGEAKFPPSVRQERCTTVRVILTASAFAATGSARMIRGQIAQECNLWGLDRGICSCAYRIKIGSVIAASIRLKKISRYQPCIGNSCRSCTCSW